MVYYRKYRPQTIAELDNPKLRQTLTSVLSTKDVPHSFLFTGPKGLGKTSTARIIAKSLNCLKRKGVEPCNVCEQCVSITNGSNIDVLEIDGASNRGIDEIRELRDRVNLAPSAAKMKVYIIDEVHMLTTEAFNALLKTIEEPPAHVVFIFCTTEPQKVPATIISRCFHISLSRATKQELVHALQRIVLGEKLDVAENALEHIAEMGDGGFRDATKILEELVAVSNGQKITKEFIETYYKANGIPLHTTNLLACLHDTPPNVQDCLRIVQQVVEQGTDMKYFISEILSEMHHILLRQIGIEGTTTSYPENVQFDLSELSVLTQLLTDAYQQTKYAVIPQLPLELAIITWCFRQHVDGGEDSTQESPKQEDASSSGSRNDGSVMGQSGKVKGKPTVTDLLKKEKNLKVQTVLGKAPVVVALPKKEDTHKQENLPENPNGNAAFMENIIYKVKPYNHSVAGVLRGCTIKLMDGEKIVFETPYKFHKEKLEEGKTREILENGVREITGKNLQVMVELKQ